MAAAKPEPPKCADGPEPEPESSPSSAGSGGGAWPLVASGGGGPRDAITAAARPDFGASDGGPPPIGVDRDAGVEMVRLSIGGRPAPRSGGGSPPPTGGGSPPPIGGGSPPPTAGDGPVESTRPGGGPRRPEHERMRPEMNAQRHESSQTETHLEADHGPWEQQLWKHAQRRLCAECCVRFLQEFKGTMMSACVQRAAAAASGLDLSTVSAFFKPSFLKPF
jgi:hypothetical protein